MNKLVGMGLGAFFVVACSSSDDSTGGTAAGGNTPIPPAGTTTDYVEPDAAHICDLAVNQCPQGSNLTMDECQLAYTSLRVSPACAAKLNAITCASTTADLNPADCFPPCTGSAFVCDGSHLSQCGTNGTIETIDCDALCKGSKGTWSGVCGTSFQGQQSPTAKCWCVI